MSGVLTRLYRGETTFNFVGRRWWGFGLSLFLIVVTMLSLFTRGLNLGIDFEGGVAWEVPATSIKIEDVTAILEANRVDTADAKIQSLNGSDGSRIRVQVAEQTAEVKSAVQSALAEKAKVDVQDVSVSSVSSSWGRSITEKAVRALLIFCVHCMAVRMENGTFGDFGDGPRRADQCWRVFDYGPRRNARHGNRILDNSWIFSLRHNCGFRQGS